MPMPFATRRHSGLVALLGPCLWLAGACGQRAELAPAAQPAAPVRVETLVAEEVASYDEYAGTVRSRDATDIRSRVTGRVTEIRIRAGQTVEAGDVLMTIDQGRQQAMVSRARAASASATSDLQRARADLIAMEASRDAAASQLEFARKQRERVRALFAADNASREAYERATADFERARAQHAALGAQLDAQRAAIASLQSSVDESRSSLREDQAELAYYNVEAPIGGRLGDVPVRVGDLVVPNTPLTSLQGNAAREVYVQVPVDQHARLTPGMTLQVVGPDGEPLASSEVDFVSPQVDPATQTVLIKAPIAADSPLLPGQYVRARVVWERRVRTTLPPSAVKRLNTERFAFVVRTPEGAAPAVVEQRPVTLGRLQGGRYTVREGLQAGERVVVAGIQRLRDGAEVSIEAPRPPTPPEPSPAGQLVAPGRAAPPGAGPTAEPAAEAEGG